MSESIEIKQSSSKGANGTQIGVFNQYTGLSPADAVAMALKIFQEYYPQMKSEILEEIREAVFAKLKDEPVEQIVAPNPRIAFPAIQNACITPEISIREMYEEVLASSMRESVKDGVHPGFVDIIRQLCPDEAKILHYMKYESVIPTITVRYETKEGGGFNRVSDFSIVGEMLQCEYPFKVAEYFDNLCRLGLTINHGELSSLTDKKKYEPLKNHPLIKEQLNEKTIKEKGYARSRVQESYVSLTSFGKSFCSVCIEFKPLIIRQPTYE